MSEPSTQQETIDWSKTTWEGARREALRRWSQLPLERIIAAIEEMEELAVELHRDQSVRRNKLAQ